MAASANQSVVSGAGGPTKPIQVMDFSIATPIDVARATETLCGSPQMFHMMLGKFEDMTFLQLMKLIADSVDAARDADPSKPEEYFKKMKEIMEPAHQLKSPAGYIGASHIHYACYFIQEHFVFHRYDKMMEYYPTLLEAAVNFRIVSRQILAKNEGKLIPSLLLNLGKTYVLDPKHETIPMAQGYRIVKDNGEYYALKGS